MSRSLSMLCCLILASCLPSDEEASAVRVSLDAGQVLVGEVTAGALSLDSPLGTLDLPMHLIGEVEPVEGTDLAGSRDHVRVWLRDGSELVGKWAEPELDVDVEIGGETLAIGVPMQGVQRLQLSGDADFPDEGTFRVRTAFGDDVFIDAAETVLPLQTDLGELSPLLSEVATLTRQAEDADTWRVELRTGTVLVGQVATDALALELRIGLPTLDVPLDDLVSIERMTYDQTLWKLGNPSAAESMGDYYDVSSSGMRAQKSR